MRHRYDAYMIHEHNDKKLTKNIFIEPVCGQKVEDDNGYDKLLKGHIYQFCSKKCLDEFDEKPDEFINNKIASLVIKDNEYDT